MKTKSLFCAVLVGIAATASAELKPVPLTEDEEKEVFAAVLGAVKAKIKELETRKAMLEKTPAAKLGISPGSRLQRIESTERTLVRYREGDAYVLPGIRLPVKPGMAGIFGGKQGDFNQFVVRRVIDEKTAIVELFREVTLRNDEGESQEIVQRIPVSMTIQTEGFQAGIERRIVEGFLYVHKNAANRKKPLMSSVRFVQISGNLEMKKKWKEYAKSALSSQPKQP